jgi:predicted AlkP superfamily pyrophosphatase or phosphodiesterase
MSRKKLLLLMIDALSADYFAAHRHRMPCLSHLAGKGFQVKRMKSPVPGTSQPGRASLLSGYTADIHGIYGNRILQNGRFVPAGFEDMRAPTIATLASSAGLDVACIGHSLVRPDDVSIYIPPCWERGPYLKVIANGERSSPTKVKDPLHRLSGLPLSILDAQTKTAKAMDFSEYLIGDQQIVGAVAGLLRSEAAPDLILTEMTVTDTAQHVFGYESEQAHFAMTFADCLVGLCLDSLRQSHRESEYTLAIVSDHGHGEINKTIYVDRVLPHWLAQSECSTLHVIVDSVADREEVGRRLAEYGVLPWEGSYLPAELRERTATFVAPPLHDFGKAPVDAPDGILVGDSHYKSTHGFRPGTAADDRFCLFVGPDVPTGVVEAADAESFAPTLAAVLNLPMEHFPGRPLFAVAKNGSAVI